MKKEILTRSDFEYISGLKYYSFKDEGLGIEITLEPCFNGFDVGVYLLDSKELIREKECTNERGYGSEEFIKLEVIANFPQMRRLEIWHHALRMANRFYRSFKNYVKVRKMKIIKETTGREDPEYKIIKTGIPIHGICPKGRIN